MAYFSEDRRSFGILDTMTAAWDAVMRAREASLNSEARIAQIQALEAKTDAELAQMGIRRDDIVRHVFRDLYYL